MENVKLNEALLQVRQAQRVLVAFYQRVKDIIVVMREELDVHHCYWWNQQFDMPGTCANDILHSQRWSWDALPLSDVLFRHTPDGNWGSRNSKIGRMVEIRLVTDSVFIEYGNENGCEPSPLDMPPVDKTSTYIEITAFQIERNEGDDWGEHWGQTRDKILMCSEAQELLEQDRNWRLYRQRFNFDKLADRAAVIDEMSQLKLVLAKHGFIGFGSNR